MKILKFWHICTSLSFIHLKLYSWPHSQLRSVRGRLYRISATFGEINNWYHKKVFPRIDRVIQWFWPFSNLVGGACWHFHGGRGKQRGEKKVWLKINLLYCTVLVQHLNTVWHAIVPKSLLDLCMCPPNAKAIWIPDRGWCHSSWWSLSLFPPLSLSHTHICTQTHTQTHTYTHSACVLRRQASAPAASSESIRPF